MSRAQGRVCRGAGQVVQRHRAAEADEPRWHMGCPSGCARQASPRDYWPAIVWSDDEAIACRTVTNEVA